MVMCHHKRGTGLDKSEAGDIFQEIVTSILLNKLVILVLFWLLWGFERDLWSDGWVMYHPRGL